MLVKTVDVEYIQKPVWVVFATVTLLRELSFHFRLGCFIPATDVLLILLRALFSQQVGRQILDDSATASISFCAYERG